MLKTDWDHNDSEDISDQIEEVKTLLYDVREHRKQQLSGTMAWREAVVLESGLRNTLANLEIAWQLAKRYGEES